MMKLTFLGTGTSTGVPQMRCRCAACRSVDPRDSRLRASAMVELPTGHNVLIDCGPDLRQQLLRLDSPDLHSLLITHSHYDHVGGIDDMRPYCPTAPEGHFPVYCRPDVATDLRSRVPYCFARNSRGTTEFPTARSRDAKKLYRKVAAIPQKITQR